MIELNQAKPLRRLLLLLKFSISTIKTWKGNSGEQSSLRRKCGWKKISWMIVIRDHLHVWWHEMIKKIYKSTVDFCSYCMFKTTSQLERSHSKITITTGSNCEQSDSGNIRHDFHTWIRPPQSPDLEPVENLCAHTGRRLFTENQFSCHQYKTWKN